MDHVVLFPHLGSASVAIAENMDQLVVDNLLAGRQASRRSRPWLRHRGRPGRKPETSAMQAAVAAC